VTHTLFESSSWDELLATDLSKFKQKHTLLPPPGSGLHFLRRQTPPAPFDLRKAEGAVVVLPLSMKEVNEQHLAGAPSSS